MTDDQTRWLWCMIAGHLLGYILAYGVFGWYLVLTGRC